MDWYWVHVYSQLQYIQSQSALEYGQHVTQPSLSSTFIKTCITDSDVSTVTVTVIVGSDNVLDGME